MAGKIQRYFFRDMISFVIFAVVLWVGLVPSTAWAAPWTTWTKSLNNPVYSHSGSGAWNVASDPSVIKDGSTYRMIVSGDGGDFGPNTDGNSLIMATSSDGSTWTTLSNGANGVVVPSSTSLWDESLELPEFIKVGSEYLVFYSGYDPIVMENSGGLIFGDVGLATSTDGTTFTRSGSPVLARTPNSYDQDGITDVTIVESGGTLYMLYLGWCTQSCALNGGNPAFYTLKATSVDNGRNWTKQGLLSPQPSGIHTDLVIDVDGKYVLFYGEDNACSGTKVGIMQAEGADPFGPFTPISGNPILCLGDQSFEGSGTDGGFPSVLNDNGVGRMYYTGVSVYSLYYKIGLAETPSGSNTSLRSAGASSGALAVRWASVDLSLTSLVLLQIWYHERHYLWWLSPVYTYLDYWR